MILKMLSTLSLISMLSAPSAAAAIEKDTISEKIRGMSVREKVGQLFIVRPDALGDYFTIAQIEDVDAVGSMEVDNYIRETYLQYPCGGFALFRKNMDNPDQFRKLIRDLHALNEIPPILCIDEEGGKIARIANHPNFDVPKFDTMDKLGKTGDPAKVYHVAYTIGKYLREYGLDVNFAPVADIDIYPLSEKINVRSFGNDPVLVADMVIQYVNGMRDAGVGSCLKHFPGSGDSTKDTHLDRVVLTKTWDEIRSSDLIPFMAGIAAGCDMVMISHVSLPNVSETNEPATLSYTLITEKLRGELGYTGLIVTDALAMLAIHNYYSPTEASIKCFLAGTDFILMPYDYKAAFDGVVAAVEDGTIPMERLDESVRRILTYKQKIFGK